MDPVLSLAFTMHSCRGVYAVLLGSGVSRAAAIPTGWEIVLDLIKRLALLRGELCEPDPETWFVSAFGEPATYSGLLKMVCRKPAERQELLHAYFEASTDEEAAGLKQPTKAHHAVAALVKSGHLKVIVTTNFDRLTERALEAAGVSPIVISTADAVDGAVPLVHARCTVIKVHGDYLDVRIKNTPEELAKYDRRLSRLLDRVFDEFGLLVCGWSSEWDEALRSAIIRCKSRRYTTFWASRGPPTESALRLIKHRSADVVQIADADQFFQNLHQKVVALATLDPPHPLSVKTAAATAKRLLSDRRHRIELHDLVTNEVERSMLATSESVMPVTGSFADMASEVWRRLQKYEAAAGVVLSLFVVGGQWSDVEQAALWRGALQRLVDQPDTGGFTLLIELRRYPALLALYAGGVAAVASSNFDALRALFSAQMRIKNSEQRRAVVERLYPQALLDGETGSNLLSPGERRHTPLNDRIFDVLREPMRSVLPSDDEYAERFDRFEYFLALAHVDLSWTPGRSGAWAPIGRFGWRGRWDGAPPVFASVAAEAEAAGASWAPIRSGLFASIERFTAAAAEVAAGVSGRRWS